MIINDTLVVLPIPHFLSHLKLPENFNPEKNILSRDQLYHLLLKEKENIQKTFVNDEYLALDAINHEIVGIKSSTKHDDDILEDRLVLFLKMKQEPKYRNVNRQAIYEFTNISTLYDHVMDK